jgi:hypothetical protein
MIDNRVKGDWVFRRDQRIKRPVEELTGRASGEEMPVLSVDVQLLYKSGSPTGSPRPKDQDDFTNVLDFMTSAERDWLCRALDTVQAGHPWRAQLAERG